MADQRAMNRVFADYARTIARQYDISDVLYRLADQAVDVLQIDGAGVSVVDAAGDLRFVSATDQRVVLIEESQIVLGEGPCQDAHARGRVVACPDLQADLRWPSYREVALGQGCRGVAGIPMAVHDRKVGALDLYSEHRRDWQRDVGFARILADMATGYILNALTLRETQRQAAQLEHALQSRVIIEQAKGVLAERHRIPTSEAFQRLRDRARRTRTSVHALARQVVEGQCDL